MSNAVRDPRSLGVRLKWIRYGFTAGQAIARRPGVSVATARRYYDAGMPVRRPQGMGVRAQQLAVDVWLETYEELTDKRSVSDNERFEA
jgi:hypothetical protein